MVKDSALFADMFISSTAKEPLVFIVAPVLLLLFIHRKPISKFGKSLQAAGRLSGPKAVQRLYKAQPPTVLERASVFNNVQVNPLSVLYSSKALSVLSEGLLKSPTLMYLKLIEIFDFPTVLIGGETALMSVVGLKPPLVKVS